MSVLPGAEPLHRDGGDVGVLLCHGFTGCPASLRPWAEHLAADGLTVSLPLLPGHGTAWQDLNRSRWPQWYETVDVALSRLRDRCSTVVLGGLSMGAALALRLAEQRPADVAGLVLVNPAVLVEDPRVRALPVIRRVVPSLPAIGDDIKKPGVTERAYERTPLHALQSMLDLFAAVRTDLPKVTQPVLVFRSLQDHVVPASSTAHVLSMISSADVTEVVCPDSYHVATLDHDAPRIFADSLAFVRRVSSSVVAT